MEEKYKITRLQDLIIPDTKIAQARKWIKCKESRKMALLISGKVGSGKTTFATKLIAESDYTPYVLTLADIKNGRSAQSKTGSYLLKQLKDDVLSNRDVYSGKKKALIIDDIDSILAADKSFITDVLTLIKDNAACCAPIIITSATDTSKKINELKKRCIDIHIPSPSLLQTRRFIGKILLSEGMQFAPIETRDVLVKACNGDFRRIFLILDYLKAVCGSDGKIVLDDLQTALNTFHQREIDYGIFELSEMVLKTKMPYDDLERCYDTEKSLLPLMIHENYPIFADTIHDCEIIAESQSMADQVDNMIYSQQVWDMFHIHGYFSTIVPIWKLQQQQQQMERNADKPVIFTKMLTKSSSQATRLKSLKSVKDQMKAVGIDLNTDTFSEFIHIIMMTIDSHIKAGNNIQEIAAYLAGFGLQDESCLDILNKLFITKTTKIDTLAIKKQLKKQFELLKQQSLEEEAKQKSQVRRIAEKWTSGINIKL